jgi:RNA polymerase sigma-70 factor, ECF subfamily
MTAASRSTPHTIDREGGERCESFTTLYRRFRPDLLGYVGSVVIDRSLAEEIVDDVLLTLWEQPRLFDPARGSLRSWLFTMAYRRSVDRIRSVEAARRRDLRVGARELARMDHGNDIWDGLFERRHMRDALLSLTAKQREAVVLRYLCERTSDEMSTILGVSVGTAKTRVRDGLCALRSALDRVGPTPTPSPSATASAAGR